MSISEDDNHYTTDTGSREVLFCEIDKQTIVRVLDSI